MTCRDRALYVSVLLLIFAFSATTAESQVDQRTLARLLLTGDVFEQAQAVSATRTIGPEQTSLELRDALITLLERQNSVHKLRRLAGRSGVALEPLENAELYFRVAEAVIELQDPRAIPALAGALTTGGGVARALARFGEEAAPAVLDIVMTPESFTRAVNTGLLTLRLMAETARRPLSDEVLDGMRRAAGQRLSGQQSVTTLWWAMDLAVLLDDEDLKRTVEQLATNPNEVVIRGVEDPSLVERTMQKAADGLAGIPALPRPGP